MRRQALDIFAGVSLVLCVATAILWVRSYDTEGGVLYRRAAPDGPWQYTVHGVCSDDGSIELYFAEEFQAVSFALGVPPGPSREGLHLQVATPRRIMRSQSLFAALGFEFYDERPTWHQRLCGVGRCRGLAVSHHVLLLLTGILPMTWLMLRVREHERRLAGRCPVCGYDVRASGDRCPECGTFKAKNSR
jgi:hypothetical protein